MLVLFSEVASRGIRGDFDDEYSATSILGDGRISLIFTSVMMGISDTGVISLMVISCLTISLGTTAKAPESGLDAGMVGSDDIIPGNVVTPESGEEYL